MKGKYRVRIWGDLDLMTPAGTSLLPAGQKERGILAALLMAPGHRRSRRWLQATLWGDAAPEKAAQNLRQSISRLKRALAAAQGLLVIDRNSVWLAQDALQIEPRSPGNETLFEGLDVGEEAFEDWLLEQRQAQSETPALPNLLAPPPDMPGARPIVTLVTGRGLVPDDTEVHRLNTTLRTRLLALELIDLREAFGPVPVTRGLVFRIERTLPDLSVVTLLDAATGRMLWSATASATDSDDDATGDLINGATEALLNVTDGATHGEEAERAALLDMGRVFEGLFVPGAQLVDQMLARIQRGMDLGPNALLLALRNCVRMLQFGERRDGHQAIRREIVTKDLVQSLALAPTNSMVQALAAHTRSLFLDDIDGATEHGQIALAATTHSAICTALVALVHLRSGQTGRALELSGRAVRLGRTSRYRAFIDAVHAAALATRQEYAAAVRFSERALDSAPRFASARQIAFLGYEQTGQDGQAIEMADTIRQSTPDFGQRRITSEVSPVNLALLRAPMGQSAARLGFD